MFKYFMTKSFFRLVMIGALIAFAGVFVYALRIDQANLERMRTPEPLGQGAGKPQVGGNGTVQGRLAIQHLSSREVADRLNQIVAEGFSFNQQNYASTIAGMEKYFVAGAYQDYKNFLQTSSIETTLASQGVQSGAYVEGPPLELNRGIFGGAFKWVFEVPVTISFLPVGATTYRDEEAGVQNRRILLRVQFARVEDAKDPDAIKIEIFQVLPPRRQ